MTFRTRILLAQAPLAIALVLVAVLAVRTIGALGAGAEAILQQNYRSVLAAQRMSGALESLDRGALFRLAGRPVPAGAEGQIARFDSELALEATNVTEPGEAEAVEQLTGQWARYKGAYAALRATPDPAAAAVYFDQMATAFTDVNATTTRILELNQDAMLLKSERARSTAARMGTVMVGASLAALALGLLATSLFTARLVLPLQRLRAAADRIGGGDFAARVSVEGSDELAQLATTFNAMADRLSRYRSSSLGELLLAQQAAQSAIDSLPDAVVVFDAQGQVLIVNRAAEALLGGRLANADPALRAVLEQARSHVLAGKGAFVPRGFEDAVRVAAPGEGDLYFLARATPVYGEASGVTGATVILQDVTRLHRFDQLKNDLVATVAHEFRTPLTSLRMAVHLLLEHAAGPLTEQQTDLLHAGREETERLQRIVEELLDLAKLQGGRMQLTLRPAAPRALVEAALDAQRAIAADRQVVLAADVAPGLPEVAIDVDRLHLVFANLLTNAIRHSPPGAPVTLRVAPANGSLRFSVADEGAGIAAERREVIFEKFTQGRETPGGAGLGLSIAKEVVAAHGGQIGVVSAVGRGSEFWFTIPIDTRGVTGDR